LRREIEGRLAWAAPCVGTGGEMYKTRCGWGRWRWVHIRKCQKCGHEHRILGNDSRLRPSLPPGAIKCAVCDGLVFLG